MSAIPQVVATTADLDALVVHLAHAPLIAVDTESNAFYAYRQRICLVQIGDGSAEWAVDPLAIADLAALRDLLNAETPAKVLHAAEGDILAMQRDLGFGVRPVFDTMVAARYLGVRRFGLADLLHDAFGVTLDKRYQRHDWGMRPIPSDALAYALADVRYLLPLRAELRGRLAGAGLLEEAEEEFARITDVTPEERPFDTEGFWRIRGARDLAPRGLATLRALYHWRDERARALDRPPVKVISDDVLIGISHQLPADPAGLRRAGVTQTQIERYGSALLGAVRASSSAPAPRPPVGNGPPDPRVTARFDALRVWRRQRAEQMGVEPEVLLSNARLRALADNGPAPQNVLTRVAGLGPRKAAAYGDDITRVLSEVG